MQSYAYHIYDVFTKSPFGGNQLAVIPDARGLRKVQMQRIAREFNYSESTFVFPPKNGKDFNVRIFTPAREVPFAGHPNIGTAIALAEAGQINHQKDQARICFEEAAGDVEIQLTQEPDKTWFAELKAPAAFEMGGTVPIDTVATALSLDGDDITCDAHVPVTASVGLPFVFAEVRSQKALEKAQANTDGFRQLKNSGYCDLVHIYYKSNATYDLHTRMFAPLIGVPEDPATGSANCALAGLLAHLDTSSVKNYKFSMTQGMEIGRPSYLYAQADKEDRKVRACYIGGQSVRFSSGTLQA